MFFLCFPNLLKREVSTTEIDEVIPNQMRQLSHAAKINLKIHTGSLLKGGKGRKGEKGEKWGKGKKGGKGEKVPPYHHGLSVCGMNSPRKDWRLPR